MTQGCGTPLHPGRSPVRFRLLAAPEFFAAEDDRTVGGAFGAIFELGSPRGDSLISGEQASIQSLAARRPFLPSPSKSSIRVRCRHADDPATPVQSPGIPIAPPLRAPRPSFARAPSPSLSTGLPPAPRSHFPALSAPSSAVHDTTNRRYNSHFAPSVSGNYGTCTATLPDSWQAFSHACRRGPGLSSRTILPRRLSRLLP